jgi:hypothetical protein
MFCFKIFAEAKICFKQKFASSKNLLKEKNLLLVQICFACKIHRFISMQKKANKTILFASNQINICFIFAYICFEPNMCGASYPSVLYTVGVKGRFGLAVKLSQIWSVGGNHIMAC